MTNEELLIKLKKQTFKTKQDKLVVLIQLLKGFNNDLQLKECRDIARKILD